MAHEFPFQAAYSDQRMNFAGTVDDAFDGARIIAKTGGIDQSSYWEPSHLVHAAMDHVPTYDPARPQLISQAAEVTTSFYDGSATSEAVTDLWEDFTARALGNVMLSHRTDNDTYEATNPAFSKQNADQLRTLLGEHPALFIAIGHGGIVPATQTFLHYREAQPDSTLYPVRFSTRKQKDPYPRLSHDEVTHLQEQAERRAVVVYDDDAASGRTLKEAVPFFRNMLAGKLVLGMANDDTRRPLVKEAQGTYWERV